MTWTEREPDGPAGESDDDGPGLEETSALEEADSDPAPADDDGPGLTEDYDQEGPA
ncbi:MAG TPA: hypothetical protein VF517_08165 [Thermoleophilaceae bacterium]